MPLQEAIAVAEVRQRSRIACEASVQVTTVDKRVVNGSLRDIGMNSLYAYSEDKDEAWLIYGEKVQVCISVRNGQSKLTIEAAGTIARMDREGFVIKFKDVLEWWPVITMFPSFDRE